MLGARLPAVLARAEPLPEACLGTFDAGHADHVLIALAALGRSSRCGLLSMVMGAEE
jgi:hypothetical protein